jgi:hypothetical protein
MTSGIMLYSDHVLNKNSFLSIPFGIDFVISVAINDKLTEELGFSQHMQEAYNADIPNIALVNVNPKPYMNMFSLGDQHWPLAKDDPYMKILDKLFIMPDGVSKYAVHAVMLQINPVDSTIPGNWYTATLDNLKKMIVAKYKIPVYIMVKSDIISLYPDASQDPQVYLSNQTMLCTYSPATLSTAVGPVSPPASGSPSPNWKGIKFWWYGSQSFDFLSKVYSSYAPILQYQGTVNALNKELGFIPYSANTPSVPTPTVDNSDALARIEGKIDALTAYIMKHIM